MHEGRTYFESRLFLAARQSLERHLVKARQGNSQDLCSALNGLGSVLLELNMLPEARDCFSESIQVSATGPIDDQVRSWCNLSLCHYLSGAGEDSVAAAEQAMAKAGGIRRTHPGLYLHTLFIVGLSYIASARWSKARTIHEIALSFAKDLNVNLSVARLFNNLGLIHIELGDFSAAEEKLTRAREMMFKLEDPSGLAYTTTELGRLYLKKGELAQALRFGSLALRTLWHNMSSLDKVEVARLCELFGTVSFATGDRQGAITYLRRAATYYGQQDRWQEWEKTSATLTQVLRSEMKPVETRIVIDREDKELLRYFTALLGLMDTRDSLYPHLRGRTELVAKYCMLLGSFIGMRKEKLEVLSHAARLYDIGFTTMMDSHDSDLDQRSDHWGTTVAEQELQMVDVPKEVRLAVRHHLERFDGSGGPDGLKGEQIPLDSRIIAVVSGYVSCVIQSDDPTNSHTMGLDYVQAGAGTKYDPQIVDQFVQLHDPRGSKG